MAHGLESISGSTKLGNTRAGGKLFFVSISLQECAMEITHPAGSDLGSGKLGY